MNQLILFFLIFASCGVSYGMEEELVFDSRDDSSNKEEDSLLRPQSTPPLESNHDKEEIVLKRKSRSLELFSKKSGRKIAQSLHRELMVDKGFEAKQELVIAAIQKNVVEQSSQKCEEIKSYLKKIEFKSAHKILILAIEALDVNEVVKAMNVCPEEKLDELLQNPLLGLKQSLSVLSWLVFCHQDNLDECYKKILELLIWHGAAVGDGYTVLHLAALFKAPELARYLLKNRLVDPLALGGLVRMQSALHIALECGSKDVVDVLIDPKNYKKFSEYLFFSKVINQSDSEGKVPLHYAAQFDQKNAFDQMCKNGAIPSVKDNDGYNPFNYIQPGSRFELAICICSTKQKKKKLLKNIVKFNKNNNK